MGKQVFFRAVALTLTVILCLCEGSCARPDSEKDTRTQQLTVEQAPTTYTPAFSASAAKQGAALFGRLLALCRGYTPNEEQLQALEAQIQEQLLPRLEALSVRPDELTALLEKGQLLCALSEENAETAPSALLLQFYQTGLSVVSSQKLGGIFFSVTELYLSRLTQQCYERYEAYGYQWYLEDAHRYADLHTQLCSTLGAESFAQITAMAVFAVSLLGNAAREESRMYVLSDEELAVLLRRQADYFCAVEISQEQWGSAAEIYTALFTPQGSTLTDAELSALFRSGYFARVAQCIPTLLTLYRAMAQAVTPQQLASLRGEEREEALPVIARLLYDSSAELLATERQLELYGYSQSAEEEAALRAAGLWEEYLQYLQDTPTARAQLLSESAEAYAKQPTEENKAAFLCVARQYLRTYLPCFAFVLSRSQR